MATTIVSAGRLPVIETVLRTYDLLAKHFARGILSYIAIVLVIVGMTVVTYYYIGEPDFETDPPPPIEEWLPYILLVVASVIPQTAYFVGIVRLGANGRVDRNHLLGRRWWGRETCTFLRTILVMLILIVVLVPLILMVGVVTALLGLVTGVSESTVSSVPFYLGMASVIPIFYLLARFSLYMCSPAFDERLGLAQSWRLTRGNGWRLVFVGLLLYLPFIVGNLVLEYALGLKGTFIFAVAFSVLTVLGLMFTSFGCAIVYRAFVPRVVTTTEPAASIAAR